MRAEAHEHGPPEALVAAIDGLVARLLGADPADAAALEALAHSARELCEEVGQFDSAESLCAALESIDVIGQAEASDRTEALGSAAATIGNAARHPPHSCSALHS